jgi:hypothetical protein
MPTTFFIDRKGIIRYRYHGFSDSHKDDYKNIVNELLKEK